MSTSFLSTSLEAMKDDLMEYMIDENLDILNEFTDEAIADCVLAIASHLLLPAKVVEHKIKDYGYFIKVNNCYKGWVSVSDENTGTTGVSNTLYYPFYEEDESYFAGLCNLAWMINEAWYQCNE